jgi:glycerophosphoryl diester phosphodiesterase
MRALSLAIVVTTFFTTTIYQSNPEPVSKHKFIVIAHRGDHVIYPENTLAAYREAIYNEADFVEIDLRTTSDGHLISLHNPTVDRMTNGKGAVREMTFETLEKLKIKGNGHGDGAEDEKVNYQIPAFEQILKLCKNKINIYLDFKDADPAAAYRMIKKYGMEKQVLVYINSPEQFTGWRKTAPEMPLMLSLPDGVKDLAGMKDFIAKYHPDILDGSYDQYTAEMIACAGKNHIPVWPDIQSAGEGPADWDKAVSIGLTGLQTDHPAAIVKYLKEKKLR